MRFLALARVALDGLAHLVDLRVLRPTAASRLAGVAGSSHRLVVGLVVVAVSHVLHLLLLAIVGKLIGLFIVIIIADVNVYACLGSSCR